MFKPLPAIGPTPCGRFFAGVLSRPDGTTRAVFLLPDSPGSELVRWDEANAWAIDVGGVLPDRAVAALLFTNARRMLPTADHWTSERHEAQASLAWSFRVRRGDFALDYRAHCMRAVAVRLVTLDARVYAPDPLGPDDDLDIEHDRDRDTVRIAGATYAGDFFRGLGGAILVGQSFRVVRRSDDGVVTVETLPASSAEGESIGG